MAPLRALRRHAAAPPQAAQPRPPPPPPERALADEGAAPATDTGRVRQGGAGDPAPHEATTPAPAAATEAAVAAAQGALAALLEKAIGAMAGHVPLQARARSRPLSLHEGRVGLP